LSSSAGRCCGGGASYCPAPQLCADPAAFDPAAPYAGPDCISLIDAAFTQEMCAAAGCYLYHSGYYGSGSGSGYYGSGSASGSGSGSGSDSGSFCGSQYAGACASEDATSNGTSTGCWNAIYDFYSSGNAHVLYDPRFVVLDVAHERLA
jgi:hypothetical protein